MKLVRMCVIRLSAVSRVLLAVVVVGAAAVCLSACGGSSSSGPSSGASTASAGGSSHGDLAPVSLPLSNKSVPSINWALPGGEPATLDPAQASELGSYMVTSNMCDTLSYWNPDFTISDNLATVMAPDPTTLNLALKPGVKFWDGKPLTSADAAFSLTRIWKNEAAPQNHFFVNVTSIEPSGSDAVVVKLKQPDDLFRQSLATVAVVEKAYAEAKGKKFGTPTGGVMCSGPLEFKSWKPGVSITLAKNPNYWNPAHASRAQSIVLNFVPSSSAVTQGLQSGQYDGAYELPTSIIPALKSSSVGKLTFGRSSESVVFFAAHPGGVWANADFRNALFAAINRPEIAAGAFNNAAEPTYALIVPDYWNPQPTAQPIWKAAYPQWVKANGYNPSQAKELAKSSSVAGQTVTVAILAGDATMKATQEILQQQLAAAGIKLVIKELPATQYETALFTESARKGIDLLSGVNFNLTSDPAELMTAELDPKSIYNWSQFNDPQAWNAVLKARATSDPAEHAKLLTQAQTGYEQARIGTSLVSIDEIRFLNNRLTGGTTSYAYIFEPSLALIGAK